MSESLRNDGRVWIPKQPGDKRNPAQIPDSDRDYYLERKYPSFGNLAPRDISSRAAKEVCDSGHGVGPGGNGVYLDFADACKRLGNKVIAERYGNLFEMYQRITDEDPFTVPMRIYPAPHYSMGGLWVDYNLMSTIPGLHVIGEANFSDHGANRLGASALMQGLGDGYFVLPYTIGHYLVSTKLPAVDTSQPEFKAVVDQVREKTQRLLALKGKRSVDSIHRELGKLCWEYIGMTRDDAGLKKALSRIPELRDEFWKNAIVVPSSGEELNQELEKAGRVADFLEFAELLAQAALDRRQDQDAVVLAFLADARAGARPGKPQPGKNFIGQIVNVAAFQRRERDDHNFAHAAVWEYQGEGKAPIRNVESLTFETVKLATRSYK